MILNGHQIEPGRLYTPTEWAEMKGVATKTLAKNRSQRRGSLSSWLAARSIAAALTSSRTTTRPARRPGEKLRGSTPPPSPGGRSSDISTARKRSRRVGAPQGHVRARGVAWSESASPAWPLRSKAIPARATAQGAAQERTVAVQAVGAWGAGCLASPRQASPQGLASSTGAQTPGLSFGGGFHLAPSLGIGIALEQQPDPIRILPGSRQ